MGDNEEVKEQAQMQGKESTRIEARKQSCISYVRDRPTATEGLAPLRLVSLAQGAQVESVDIPEMSG